MDAARPGALLPFDPGDRARTRSWRALLALPLVRRPAFWLAFVGGWAALVAVFTAQHLVLGTAPGPGGALVRALVDQGTWALFCLVVLLLAWRLPLTPATWRRNLPVVLLLLPVLVLGRVLAMEAAAGWVLRFRRPLPLADLLLMGFPHHLFPALGLTAAGYALEFFFRYRERETAAARLEMQLSRARLDMLKVQLHPHFLFNTLNSVSTLMYRDVPAAERTLARLSEMLRQTLCHAGAQEVPLAEELEFVRLYLEIEQTRFGPRLQVEWRIAPGAERARVPHLVVQPLVENAIRHGIAPRRGPGRVTVSAARRGDRLEVEVLDDGLGLPEGWSPERLGMGLANTRARLEQLYGAAQEFRVEPAPGGGVRAMVLLPFRTAAPSQTELAGAADIAAAETAEAAHA